MSTSGCSVPCAATCRELQVANHSILDPDCCKWYVQKRQKHSVRADAARIRSGLKSAMQHVGGVYTETHLIEGLGSPIGEALLVVWQLLHSRPRLRRWRAEEAEDLENLINLLRKC